MANILLNRCSSYVVGRLFYFNKYLEPVINGVNHNKDYLSSIYL